MIANALKLAEALDIIVEQIVAVAVWHVRRETDKVVVHMVGKLVDVVFVFIDDLDLMGVVLVEHAHCAHHARARKARHGGDGLARAGKGDGGRGKELFIQQRKLVLDALAKAHIVLDELARELFKLVAHRQQQDGGEQAEHRVDIGDAAGSQHLIPQRIQRAEAAQHHQRGNDEDRARDIKEDMNDTRALGIGLGADGADDGRRHAVADVDADDDGVNRRKCQRAGRRDRLQNTDGRRRALQQKRNARAEQKAEYRLAGELIEHVGKRFGFRQRADRRSHAKKTGEEDTKAHGDRADGIRLAPLDHHDEQNTNDRRKGGKRRGLKEIEQRRLRRIHIEQANDLACDRRTDVCAQNHADRLVQRHYTSADKTRCQHDRRRGALDHCRDHKAEQETDERVVRHLFHCALECVGRALFQSVAHQAHTVEEQRKTAKEGDQVENRHSVSNLSSFVCSVVPPCGTLWAAKNAQLSPDSILSGR